MNPEISEATDVESQGVKRMRADVKAQWVAALRSGEYEQGTGALRKGDKFCCLGVLCDVAVKSGLTLGVDGKDDGLVYYDAQGFGLPEAVQSWAGLGDGQPFTSVHDNNGRLRISHVNDGGASFDEIADLIEAEF